MTKELPSDRPEIVSEEFKKWFAEQTGNIDYHSASLAWYGCYTFLEKRYLEDMDRFDKLLVLKD